MYSTIIIFSFSYDSNSGGEREIQRTMLELLNQLDGFDSRGDVKVCYWRFTSNNQKYERQVQLEIRDHRKFEFFNHIFIWLRSLLSLKNTLCKEPAQKIEAL